MAKKELTVGTHVTRKETGQVGLIVNIYSGNYIVELSDGDSPKHETRVVSPEVMDTDYTCGHKTASIQRTADEQAAFEQQKGMWTKGLYDLMINYIGATSPIPPSEECIGAIYTFAQNAANDIAIARSGEVYTNAAQTFIDNTAKAKVSYQRAALDKSYQDMLRQVQGDEASTAYIQKMYANQVKTIDEREKSAKERASIVRPSDYADQGYIERAAQAIWLAIDIKPRIENMVADIATQAGVDPETVMEQPVPPTEEELEKISKSNPEAAQRMQANYNEKVERLQSVAIGMKSMMKSSEELKAIVSVLPQGTVARVLKNINRSSTPAEILASLTHFSLKTLADPTTGTQTKHKRREPKMQTYERVHPYAVDMAYPELASVSDIPQEREMANLRKRFIEAASREDLAAAEQVLADLERVKNEYQSEFKELLSAAGAPSETAPRPELDAARDQFNKAMREVGQQSVQWESEAKEQLQKSAPPPKKKKEASVNNGYSAGSPVRYKDNPAVHFIVSYDDSDSTKLYLIPEKDVNSHDRAELIEATINDIQALKVYNIDIGDIVDAFGTAARVIDASAKDLGFVYAELKGSREVVPVDLSKTATSWHYAEPIQLCKCANDGGLITPGQEHNCPFIGMPMMGKKDKPDPIIDAKAPEKKAAIDLNAALESLDPAAEFPTQPVQKASEIYEDESNPIEIGSTVKKFGTAITGTVVGFKRQCCVVDWETGKSEACWKQELVLVNKVEDGN